MDTVHTLNEFQRILIDNQPMDIFFNDTFAYLFEERALLLAGKNDVVILRNFLPEEYLNFIRENTAAQFILLHCSDNKRELAEIILDSQNIELIRKLLIENNTTCKPFICSYIPDKKIRLVAAELGISIFGEKFFWDNYRKSDTQRICTELGFKIIPSVFIEQQTDFATEKVYDFIDSYKKILIKPNMGIGGQSISFYDANDTQVLPFLPAVIQEYLIAQLEGSIQFLKSFDGWKIYLCETFQNANKFCGFRYPLTGSKIDELELSACKFLNYFTEIYGNDIPSFGIDFIISNNEVYFHDINPRNTGVTYIFSFIDHLYNNKNNLSNIELMYLQNECDYSYSYSELRKKFDACGLTHISKSSTDGYALLYPSMLEAKLVNILLVSSNGKINEYRQMLNSIIG